MISIVSPFYNEEVIIEDSVHLMLQNLESLSDEWELIIVDDGSVDHSLQIARRLEQNFPKLRVLSYLGNRGRGYALRFGVAQARGDIVITTEIDSSWGNDIVHRIVAEFKKRPDADIIIASPHLHGGGYRNVPVKRVLLSTLGNYIIRSGLTYSVTMNTGMTRGYRREKFLALPLDEDDKEMHLEIVNKALAFGYRIYEIPAVLEWKEYKLSIVLGKKRKSSSNINKLIQTHILFSLLAAPFRYIYLISILLGLLSFGLFVWAFINLLTPDPSIYLFLSSLLIALFAFLIFGIGILSQQGRALQRELWRVRSKFNIPKHME
ncbi:MAG: glycosyltransferase family 2 protein [Thermodesulfobacteriota bacterium]